MLGNPAQLNSHGYGTAPTTQCRCQFSVWTIHGMHCPGFHVTDQRTSSPEPNKTVLELLCHCEDLQRLCLSCAVQCYYATLDSNIVLSVTRLKSSLGVFLLLTSVFHFLLFISFPGLRLLIQCAVARSSCLITPHFSPLYSSSSVSGHADSRPEFEYRFLKFTLCLVRCCCLQKPVLNCTLVC